MKLHYVQPWIRLDLFNQRRMSPSFCGSNPYPYSSLTYRIVWKNSTFFLLCQERLQTLSFFGWCCRNSETSRRHPFPDWREGEPNQRYCYHKNAVKWLQKKVLTIQNLTILTYFDFKKSFPLGKFKYMRVYFRWFHKKNFRKYVNIPSVIWGSSFS